MLLKIIALFLLLPLQVNSSEAKTWIKAGYWYSGSAFPIPDIDSTLFTHLICAFARINPSSNQVSILPSDEPYFSTFTDIVKQKNPSIITLLSIKVDDANSNFFPMVSQASRRNSFIESSIRAARLYGFHGIDLWGVPPTTSTNMTNIGTLLDEWRAAINSEQKNSSQSRLILTMAGHYLPTQDSASYPINPIKRSIDWLHIIAYDYHLPSRENFTGAHAALYDPSGHVNTDYGIKQWIAKGLPASKMVLGLPYHGYTWILVNPKDNRIGAPAYGYTPSQGDASRNYKYIRWYMKSYGASSVYNATYVVNYLTIESFWIGFDDVEAIRTKVSYAKDMGLLGYNVWQVPNDYNWVLSKAAQGESRQRGNKESLLVILLPTISVLTFVLGTMIWYLQRRVRKRQGIMDRGKKSATPNCKNNASHNLQVFSFTDIKVATNNFSSEYKLGEGGYGPVYKGQLPDGQAVAVKRLSETSKQGAEEFKNEVSLTANLQHVNLVPLLGFCMEREEKLLIYEYMPNKSLDFYLYDADRRLLLDWEKWVHIIEGVTQGLLYLQEYSRFTIVHRDLKASNILLDNEMKPKISDFGIAKIFQKDELEANTSRIVGTYGYVPPEYVKRGIYSTKYDVYSFGVVLLQIISGKKTSNLYGQHENLNLLEYAYEMWKDDKGKEFMDPLLDDAYSSCKLMRCMHVALLCIQEKWQDRPSMLQVSSMLKNETEVLPTPKMPAFSINKDKEEANFTPRQDTCSVNDATVSEVVPR